MCYQQREAVSHGTALYITKMGKKNEPGLKSIHLFCIYEKNKAVIQIFY